MTATAVTARQPGRLARLRRDLGREETRWAFLFLLPWIIGFLIFTAGPMLASLYLSFTKYSVIKPPQLVGLTNYQHLLDDRRIPLSLVNTAIYAVLHVPGVIIISLILALMLLRVGRAAGFFRTAFYLPNVTPAVAVGTLFLLLLSGGGSPNLRVGARGFGG